MMSISTTLFNEI